MAPSTRFEDAPAEARLRPPRAFGEILRGGRYIGAFTYDDVLRIASAARATTRSATGPVPAAHPRRQDRER